MIRYYNCTITLKTGDSVLYNASKYIFANIDLETKIVLFRRQRRVYLRSDVGFPSPIKLGLNKVLCAHFVGVFIKLLFFRKS